MIVTNQSNVKYSYTIPGEPTQSGEEYSNPVDTEILSSAISKVKTSDRTTIGEGETARQTVVITNNSGVALQNVTFKDVMTDGATYVSGSVEVNGVSQPSYDLITGFSRGRQRFRILYDYCRRSVNDDSRHKLRDDYLYRQRSQPRPRHLFREYQRRFYRRGFRAHDQCEERG